MATKNTGSSNTDQLRTARLPLPTLTAAERAAVESLTDAEVDAIVSAKNKLGGAFIKKHVPHGMMF